MWWAALHVQRWPFNLGPASPGRRPPGSHVFTTHMHVESQGSGRCVRPGPGLPVVEESLGPPCCTATAPTFLLQHPSILREVLTLSKPPGTTRSHSRAVTVLPGAGPPPRGCPCAWLSSFRPAPGAGVWLSPRAIRPAGPSLTRHMQEVLRTPAFSSVGQEWDCLVAAWGPLHSHLSGSEYHLAPPRRGLAPPDLTVQPGFCPMTSQAGGTLTTRWPAWGW